MAERSHHRRAERARPRSTRSAPPRRRGLFDIRRLIGGLFLIYGVILTVLGLGESDASIAKSADINVNLYAGSACSSWAPASSPGRCWRPLGRRRDESEQAGGGSGGDGDDAVGARAAGR